MRKSDIPRLKKCLQKLDRMSQDGLIKVQFIRGRYAVWLGDIGYGCGTTIWSATNAAIRHFKKRASPLQKKLLLCDKRR